MNKTEVTPIKAHLSNFFQYSQHSAVVLRKGTFTTSAQFYIRMSFFAIQTMIYLYEEQLFIYTSVINLLTGQILCTTCVLKVGIRLLGGTILDLETLL